MTVRIVPTRPELDWLDTAGGHILVCLVLILLCIAVVSDPMPMGDKYKDLIGAGLWTLASGVLGRALRSTSEKDADARRKNGEPKKAG